MKPSPRDLLLARAREAAPELDAQRERLLRHLSDAAPEPGLARLLYDECIAPLRTLWTTLGTASALALLLLAFQPRSPAPASVATSVSPAALREWAANRPLGAWLASRPQQSASAAASPASTETAPKPVSLRRPCLSTNAA